MIPFVPAPYQLIAKIIGALILVVSLGVAWHNFTQRYVEQGRAELRPKLASCYEQNQSLILNAKIMVEREKEAQNKALEAIKKAQPKLDHWRNQKIAPARGIELKTCDSVANDIKGRL